jgi:hypothetical protein
MSKLDIIRTMFFSVLVAILAYCVSGVAAMYSLMAFAFSGAFVSSLVYSVAVFAFLVAFGFVLRGSDRPFSTERVVYFTIWMFTVVATFLCAFVFGFGG